MKCRFCKTELHNVFIDLVNSPASNSFLEKSELNEPETYYPLKVFVCDKCRLVQVDEYKKSGAIFDNKYVYFSSFSTSWLKHAEKYTQMMIERFHFDQSSLVVEVASNDGYLLQYFHREGIPVLGIEPTANTAAVAKEKGIDSVIDFFGERLARELVAQGKKADLLLGNNVLAHVPDIQDFVRGMKIMLNYHGVITMEFPHLMQLVENSQFDTIYHEHFSYLSFYTVKEIFAASGLEMFDVEQIPTHGGSLRIYLKHQQDNTKEISGRVAELLALEEEKGMGKMEYYTDLQEKAFKVKLDLLRFLVEQKAAGKVVAAYGAAAKGNTLLNYCGVKNDLISFVVDLSPHKQGKYMPASHIPVFNEEHLKNEKPDYILILPWNLRDEITAQLAYVREWGGQFVIPIPRIEVI
ncbi:class I SAM-dependent methyltransferase [Hufsiella ginkgonis]|uniref:Methyltransferase domain-containing protein n=1 Tax=Hufsiella ginkgonis TaxID=2695274 RepID=A0A7K1Y3X4_9SPHI|nr:class I SAM-dependent methyltransferase [Hufsiella ginkgonis]MXV17396.1 methyltransferase domain-containing protein [Hufsiella ginkgonis]